MESYASNGRLIFRNKVHRHISNERLTIARLIDPIIISIKLTAVLSAAFHFFRTIKMLQIKRINENYYTADITHPPYVYFETIARSHNTPATIDTYI